MLFRSEKFTKVVDVNAGTVQPLWVGIDVDANQAPGVYSGYVHVNVANSESRKVKIMLTVTNAYLADRGDSDLEKYSRLRWLNSTLGIDSLPTNAYSAIEKIGARSYAI